MKIAVTLTQKEIDDISGWVALYRAHPELIGKPNTAWPPNGQTRIVLDSCTRERFDEIAAQFPITPPGPTPTTPLEAFEARRKVSENCAWVLITPEESGAVRAEYGDQVSQYNQFYTVGGSGGLGIAERVDSASPSGYSYADASGQWAHDVGGAADKRVAEIAASQNPPRPVPAPIVKPS